jgi:hypothetical protein
MPKVKVGGKGGKTIHLPYTEAGMAQAEKMKGEKKSKGSKKK